MKLIIQKLHFKVKLHFAHALNISKMKLLWENGNEVFEVWRAIQKTDTDILDYGGKRVKSINACKKLLAN